MSLREHFRSIPKSPDPGRLSALGLAAWRALWPQLPSQPTAANIHPPTAASGTKISHPHAIRQSGAQQLQVGRWQGSDVALR